MKKHRGKKSVGQGRRPERGQGQRRPAERTSGVPERTPRTRRERLEREVELVEWKTLGSMLASYGQKLERPQLEQLARFHALLLEGNRKLNLTRIWNLKDIVVKHYVDSLIILNYLSELPSPLLDIGTGGGFPGIPLKIARPETHVILGEGVRKRVEFLRGVRSDLQLDKLDLIGRNIDKSFEYPVNGVITRAVEPIRDTLQRIRNCLLPEGLAIFMKGPNVDDELRDAGKEFPDLYRLKDDIRYQLPGTPFRRRLIIYAKKVSPTDAEAADGDN